MKAESIPDLTLLAMAVYEAIQRSMKGEQSDEATEKTQTPVT